MEINSQQAIATNLEASYLLLARAWQAEIAESAELTWFLTGKALPICNGVVRSRLSPEDADQEVANLTAQAIERHLPMTWLLGPSSQPEELAQRLLAHGWRHDEEVPGMAVSLEGHPFLTGKLPEEVLLVQDSDMLTLWVRVFCAGFGLPTAMQDLFLELYRTYGFTSSPTIFYLLGMRNRAPVGTALLSLAGGYPGIYAVTTLPSARRQGIGRMLTLAAMELSHQKGYELCTLQATAMGINLYRALGWQQFASFHTYTFLPAEE